MSDNRTTDKTPPPPNGTPADMRIVGAVVELCNQFAVCGLDNPVAIVVKRGQRMWIEAMLARSSMTLVMDKLALADGRTKVWGVEIKEE